MSEFNRAELQQLQDAMDEVWFWHATKQTDEIFMSVNGSEMLRVVSDEQRWRERICSPAGLASIFPALRH